MVTNKLNPCITDSLITLYFYEIFKISQPGLRPLYRDVEGNQQLKVAARHKENRQGQRGCRPNAF
jgi:hypothetical protein